MKSTPPSYDPSLIKKKRARLTSDLFPYKKIYANFNLKVSKPDELENPILMDATPMHSLQLPAKSFFKASKKKKKVIVFDTKPVTVLSDNIENSRDLVESPSCN